jgi:3-isopropylmalate/(R)-2-methylmalate dehydratase small subunit
MIPFERLEAVAAPLPSPNIDTDQIIPARFLQKPRKEGYADFLFRDLRFDSNGAPKPDFVLNKPASASARILVAGRNFGCGSSREGAVYALWDYGFRSVIASSFGDIFYGNSLKNGFLPIVLPQADVDRLMVVLAEFPGATLAIDLADQSVTSPTGTIYRFDIDPYVKQCLLRGIDELDYTLSFASEIAAFEARAALAHE